MLRPEGPPRPGPWICLHPKRANTLYTIKANTVVNSFFFIANFAACGSLSLLLLLLDLPGSVLVGLGLGPDGPASPLPIAMDPAGPGWAGITVAHNISIIKLSL
ncbi:hypothetical protein LZ31DRAFT_556563 [Colletotrichum somersetense]|nr:hypothetical protein LZ31DRAFT_556563 [Colletotrichum somersetense]